MRTTTTTSVTISPFRRFAESVSDDRNDRNSWGDWTLQGQIVGGQMCPKIIDRFLTGQAKGTPLANPWKTGLED